ncbi:RNase E specificity factor CsrD [Parashewanella spongiae]|uniref:RNase E specificity factor CsrD n=1 Tax=Parashewanella spongiae TaxID=342950 RepID=A0A3A6UJX5_9GAMM|nr:RNase E specificity factor CsrD [Parashewanella spongiae]MCL1078873.1 RNase E specificity factor CsrD [Parashewanella spongiae]RJY17846.1 RNase E specificity factor CsrD [Parashewanella spongiae]
MKLTRVLTKKLASFWFFSLASVAIVFVLAAFISFFHLANRIQEQQVAELKTMLIDHHKQYESWDLETWLPPVLMSYKTISFELKENHQQHFVYQGNLTTSFTREYDLLIDEDAQLTMYLKLEAPYKLHRIDGFEVAFMLLALSLIGLFVRFGFKWLSKQLFGVEELIERGQLILEGNHNQAIEQVGNGQPKILNEAITQLLEELQDAHKERSRFDKFIRSNTFLDAETGIGNRLFLKNRLAALSNDYGMLSHGVVYFLEMEELDIVQQEIGDVAVMEFLLTCVNGIDTVLQSQANSFLARRSFNQLAIVVPQISLMESDSLAGKILNICLRLPLPEGVKADNFFHIGGAYFSVADDSNQLLEEAEMALRAAQYQGNSTWFMYDKGIVDQEFAKGSVRWRSLLEVAIEKHKFEVFVQPVVDYEESPLHLEVFGRIRESKESYIRAPQYVPMAVKCGLMPQIDRLVINMLLTQFLKQAKYRDNHYCINLSLDSILSDSFVHWLKNQLLEHRNLVKLLTFEITESIAIRHQAQIKPVFNLLAKMGASLSVDSVGQQVVGSQYLKELGVHYIKLHPSIVRQIHLRPENQLFVRSLIGSLYRTDVQLCAQGVETFEEWQTLKILGVSGGQGTLFSDIVSLYTRVA